jgi:hypothetical protein
MIAETCLFDGQLPVVKQSCVGFGLSDIFIWIKGVVGASLHEVLW